MVMSRNSNDLSSAFNQFKATVLNTSNNEPLKKLNGLLDCLSFISPSDDPNFIEDTFVGIRKSCALPRDIETQKAILVFELLSWYPRKLLASFTHAIPLGETLRQKQYLQNIPLFITNTKNFIDYVMVMASEKLPSILRGNDENDFRMDLEKLFEAILLSKKAPVNANEARSIMNELFAVYQTHDSREFPGMIQNVLSAWVAELADSEMRFVLRGHEERFRRILMEGTASLNPEGLVLPKENYRYNKLLREFIMMGRSDCVDRFVGIGANIDQSIDGEPMLLRLMHECIIRGTISDLTTALNNLLPKIAFQSYEVFFNKLMDRIDWVNRMTPREAVELCFAVLNSKSNAMIAANFNVLLEKVIYVTAPDSTLPRDIVTARPDLVDVPRLYDRLKRCIAEGKNKQISSLLDILNICFESRAVHDAQIAARQSGMEFGSEMHELTPTYPAALYARFPDSLDAAIANTLTSLSYSVFYSSNDYERKINSLWEKLRTQKISSSALIVDAVEHRYERAIAVFEMRYAAAMTPIVGKSALSNRAQFSNNKDYLCHIIAHGAHTAQPIHQHEDGRRTREVLENLGWIRGGAVTALAPIMYDDVRAFKGLPAIARTSSITAGMFRDHADTQQTLSDASVSLSASA